MSSAIDDSRVTRATLFLRLRQDGEVREVAWREFYEAYAPLIGAFARKSGADHTVAEDVVQDVLVGFYSVSPEFTYNPMIGRFRGYLKTCTWRKLQKRLRADARINDRMLNDIDTADIQVNEVWEDIWEREKLHRAVEMVRARYSVRPDKAKTFQAFEMYAMLDRPAEEIAAELGMNIESVHQAKSRVIRMLRETMDAIEAFAD
jgi:RNA polymerase sigma factor (sigma-70 family)